VNNPHHKQATTTASQQLYGGDNLLDQPPPQRPVNPQQQSFIIKGSRRNVDAKYNDYQDSDSSHFDAANFEEHSLHDWSWGDKI
jgi:hypothetical protein